MLKSMKTSNKNWISAIVSSALCVFMMACETNTEVKPQQDILPTSFSVDIPSTISNSSFSGGRIGGRTKEDSLKGNDIYLHLGTFIAVGEGASQLVEEFIEGMNYLNGQNQLIALGGCDHC